MFFSELALSFSVYRLVFSSFNCLSSDSSLSILAESSSIFSVYSPIILFLDNRFALFFILPPVIDPPGFSISPSRVAIFILYLVSLANCIALSISSITTVFPSSPSTTFLYFSSNSNSSDAIPIGSTLDFTSFKSIKLGVTTFNGRNVTLPLSVFFRNSIASLAHSSSSVIIFCIAAASDASIAFSYFSETEITCATAPSIPLSFLFFNTSFTPRLKPSYWFSISTYIFFLDSNSFNLYLLSVIFLFNSSIFLDTFSICFVFSSIFLDTLSNSKFIFSSSSFSFSIDLEVLFINFSFSSVDSSIDCHL